MKKFVYGLAAGLAVGVAAQIMIARNQERMLELVKGLPKPFKFSPDAPLDELISLKKKLEGIIRKKASKSYLEDEESEFG